MALARSAVNRQDHQTADHEAHTRGRAVGDKQQPYYHCYKHQIHDEDLSCLPLLTIGPACHGIPKKEDSTDQTHDAKCVLACCRSRILLFSTIKRVMYCEITIVLDEKNGKRDQQVAKAPKHRTDSLQGVRIGENDKNHEV